MLNLGSPAGNPGYSFAAGAYNPQSGKYEGGGATWVGQGQAPAGSQDQFRNWVGSQNQGAANGMSFVGQAPNYGSPNAGPQGGAPNPMQPGQALGGQQRPVMDNAYYNGLDQAGQANFNTKMGQDPAFIAAMQNAQYNAGISPNSGQAPAQGGYPQQGGNVQAGGPGGYNPGGGGTQWGAPGQSQNIAGSVQGGQLAGTFGQAAPGMAPPTGLIGSEMAQQQGLSGALGGIQGGLNNYNQQANRASSLLGGFATNGQGANSVMAAQSGALGEQAQQDAYNNFNDSPGQQFLRDRGEQAIVRNAAATGGLGGGNVQKALATFGQGLAQQDFSNQFNRLGQVSNQGFAATQGQSNIAQNQGQAGLNSGNLAANYNFNTGQQMGAGRTRTGEQIADSVSNTTSGLANLINQQGQNLSGIVGAGGNNISSLLAGLGQQTGLSQEQLAAMLGNISIGQSSQVASQPSLGQFVQSGGATGAVSAAAGGLGGILTALG